MRRYLVRIAVLLAALVIVGTALVACTTRGRAAYNTALFITQTVPSLPAITWGQPEPTVTRVTVDTPEGPRPADLYRPPGDGPFAAVVVFLGVTPAGADDPRVVNLGKGLARSGFATLIYWSPQKIEGRIHGPDVQNLVAAFAYLRSQPFVDAGRVGYAGFCVGASFVLMAAAQPQIRDDVAFVNAFGPYYDMRTLVRAIGTRTQPTDDGLVPWEIDRLSMEVTQRMLLEDLPEAEAMKVRQLLEGQGQVENLSAEGRAVHRILAGGTAGEVEAAMASLPDALLDRMDSLSPKRSVDGLRAPVLIMHDRADNLVPSSESRALVAALADHPHLRYTEFSLFQHVDPTRGLRPWEQAWELAKLYRHLYATMLQAAR